MDLDWSEKVAVRALGALKSVERALEMDKCRNGQFCPLKWTSVLSLNWTNVEMDNLKWTSVLLLWQDKLLKWTICRNGQFFVLLPDRDWSENALRALKWTKLKWIILLKWTVLSFEMDKCPFCVSVLTRDQSWSKNVDLLDPVWI